MQTHVFHDFDAFAASVRGVDSKMILRNANRRLWTISSVGMGGIELQVGRLGSGNIAEGQLRPDGRMLYLPLTDGVEYVANGTRISKDSFAMMDPGCEFCFSTRAAHDWCVIFVPNSLWSPSHEAAQFSLGTPRASTRVSRPHRAAAERFRSCAREVLRAASACPDFESSSAAKHAQAELLQVAALVVNGDKPERRNSDGRPKIPRGEVLRRSRDFLERADARVRMEDLATAAGVSERTLRRAFVDYFGVSPIRYLQLRHLNQVHRVLKRASPEETTVTEVLVRFGEWDFSRFASRYRRLFGELPVETLRKRPV